MLDKKGNTYSQSPTRAQNIYILKGIVPKPGTALYLAGFPVYKNRRIEGRNQSDMLSRYTVFRYETDENLYFVQSMD